MLRRRKSETASSPPWGGWPRPSFRWQLWQGRALKIGPRPSEDLVELGEDTQSLRKMPSPTRKSSCRSKLLLAEGWGNTLRLIGSNEESGRAHGWTPVTSGHLVCRRRLEKT